MAWEPVDNGPELAAYVVEEWDAENKTITARHIGEAAFAFKGWTKLAGLPLKDDQTLIWDVDKRTVTTRP